MAPSLRLMTANLLGERVDPLHFSAALDQADPDLLIVQELADDAAEVIASRYRHHHLRPSLEFHGRGMASRFDAEFGDLALHGRPGTWGRLRFGSSLLTAAGVHFLNPVNFPWWVTAQGRSRQLLSLSEWADRIELGAVVVAGDLNAAPRWPVYRRMRERWVDLVAEGFGELGRGPAPTWSPFPGWPRLLRIDHVFGSGLRATDASSIRLVGSDHSAVVVDLETLASQ